jgi:predicted DNA-binding transcriptional regulator YafY
VRTATRIPLLRIAAIDRAIRAGEYPNARTIARELEVCPRTIHRDIEFIRDHLQAPLAFDPVRNGYFYENPSFELPLWKLTEGELLAIFGPIRSASRHLARLTLSTWRSWSVPSSTIEASGSSTGRPRARKKWTESWTRTTSLPSMASGT